MNRETKKRIKNNKNSKSNFVEMCSDCNGSGHTIEDSDCSGCNGKGTI